MTAGATARCRRSPPTTSASCTRSGRCRPDRSKGHQAPPMVNNGVMFVATPGNQVLAINAKTGDLLWRFRRPPPEDQFLLHPTSRGVGLWGDKVFLAASDATLVALDAKTGKQVWATKVRGLREGLLHVAGAAGDRRQGADRHVGRRTRRTRLTSPRSMPRPARNCGGPTPSLHQASPAVRPGRRAISGRPAAVRCGSPASTIRQTNLTFWGTGNPGPWMGDKRPGDNLYTTSVMALDAASGKTQGPLPVPPERFMGLG